MAGMICEKCHYGGEESLCPFCGKPTIFNKDVNLDEFEMPLSSDDSEALGDDEESDGL